MRILITGSSGQIGSALRHTGSLPGQVLYGSRKARNEADRLDIGDFSSLEKQLSRVHPEVVINTAAYTAVDRAESEPEKVFRINAEAPELIASWCRDHQARLIHYSTDYVFDGSRREPYRETDTPAPQSVYGASKLAGETAVQNTGCDYFILRTGWVYSPWSGNFVKTILRLARERPRLTVVNDQWGNPTSALSLAGVTESLCRQDARVRGGLYHYSDNTTMNWYDFAVHIVESAVQRELLIKPPEITAIPSEDFPQDATRPVYSVLNSERIQQQFNIRSGEFQTALEACLAWLQEHDI